MALADEALLSIHAGVYPVTCHIAVWFWAAQVAQAQGLTGPKDNLTTLGNIVALAPNAQGAMLALPRSGNWNFQTSRAVPQRGTVMLWVGAGTHAAVVDQNGMIAGYNQVVQFPHLFPNVGHTAQPWTNLAQNHRVVVTVAEATIVNQAGALGL